MEKNTLKEYYEKTSKRFWDPLEGLSARDSVIDPLLKDISGTIIEYGCGSGSLLINLAKEERFSSVTGVDISENLLDSVNKAWEKLDISKEKSIDLFLPTNDTLPYIKDNTFDVVICCATIEHVINPYTVLDELYRIAKPGATLICSVPNYGYIKHSLRLLLGMQPRTGTDEPVEKWRECGWDGMHLHTFTKSSFEILLNDCGWKVEKWTGWGYKGGKIGNFFRKKFPGKLSGEIITVCKKNN